ncbi:MAG: hypothetical protein NT080_13415 [Spirochaetes bacterium]|nr:hypothetical protein [Spirochaetota bacterium]
MKNTGAEKNARERMRPGIITAGGFFGSDDRTIADIVQADEEEFRRLDLDFEKVAARLAEYRETGSRGLGEPVTVGRKLVCTGDARGLLPCPFGDGAFHKNSMEVSDTETGERLVLSDLSIHLLGIHHFLQGRGCEFRLDPEVLSRMLA